ncbi:MAG: DUF4091 domain-containing protein [Armatimonadetes bacterium]|nr:DUF4091 domain-containing protein [Armatimonadota bacterium]
MSLRIVHLLVLVLLEGIVFGQNAANTANNDPPRLEVFWTDTPPGLDGSMGDACWKQAEAATSFRLLSGTALTQKTEVRFAYDGENLYVFWIAYESDMSSVLMGAPEKQRDQIDRTESAELMFLPTHTDKEYFMFAASPLGARYDLSWKTWTDFNPEWQCVAGRFKGGWTLEEKIPFAEFAEVGCIGATPQVGDDWGLNIYRKKANPLEVSQCTSTSADAGLVFRGRKTGDALPRVVKRSVESLLDGTAKCELTVENAKSPVVGECLILRGGQQKGKAQATLTSPNGVVRLAVRMKEAGPHRLRFSLTSGEKVFFSGQALVAPSPLAVLLRALQSEAAAGKKVVAESRHPEFIRIRKELEDYARASRNAGQQPANEQEVMRRLNRLRRDLHLARLYPGKVGQPSVPFAIGAVTESDKVYPDTLYKGPLTEPIRLAIAGNEYGSLQLVVIPFWQDLREVNVSFSPLTRTLSPPGRGRGEGSAVIPVENLRWFRVSYVKLEDPPAWAKVTYQHRYEPDPLMPPAPFDVPSVQVAAVWVDVLMPEGMPEGTYSGQVTVTANGRLVSRSIGVRSYGFDIPKRSSLETDFWFSPTYNWNAFYLNAEKTVGICPYTPELHARHADVLGRYRISSFPSDWTFLCREVPIHQEADGRFTFDWSRFDKYIQNGLRNNSTAFWCALSCNSGWTAYLNAPTVPVIERATGKRITVGDIVQPLWDKHGEATDEARAYGKAQFENPVYREFLVAYVKHLKELGINDFSYYELFDEANQDPPPHTRWNAMIEHHQFFRKLVPDLHLLNFGFNPTQVVAGKSALGLIDVWAPHLLQLDERVVPRFEPGEGYKADQTQPSLPNAGIIHDAIVDRRAKQGEKYWTYTCTQQVDSQGNYTPYSLYHQPYIALRIHSWMAWRFQWDGFLIYALNGVPKVNLKPPSERWPLTDWSDGADMGCGTLVYPGPDFELIPGMRLANARDGLEDYEYFAVLRNEAKKLDPTRDARLLAKIAEALKMDKDIVSSVYVWTKDRERLEKKREELARLIREARAAD